MVAKSTHTLNGPAEGHPAMRPVAIVVIEPRRQMVLPPSDRLYGALAWATVWLFPEDRWFIEQPDRFVLSSAFPMLVSGRSAVRLWPRPAFDGTHFPPETGKRLKKVVYVSEHIWRTWIEERVPMRRWAAYLENHQWCLVSGDRVLITREEQQALRLNRHTHPIRTVAVQHAAIDRISMSTTPGGRTFYEDTTWVAHSIRYWFAVRMDSDDVPFFQALMRFLADRGIGGNRSSGQNHFRYVGLTWSDDPWWSPRSRRWIALSRYVPAPDEVDWEGDVYYSVRVNRPRAESEGPVAARVLKRAYLYWEEGAVVTARTSRERYGKMLRMRILADGAPLYHSGIALPAFRREAME